jgi:hypothetical protein
MDLEYHDRASIFDWRTLLRFITRHSPIKPMPPWRRTPSRLTEAEVESRAGLEVGAGLRLGLGLSLGLAMRLRLGLA